MKHPLFPDLDVIEDPLIPPNGPIFMMPRDFSKPFMQGMYDKFSRRVSRHFNVCDTIDAWNRRKRPWKGMNRKRRERVQRNALRRRVRFMRSYLKRVFKEEFSKCTSGVALQQMISARRSFTILDDLE